MIHSGLAIEFLERDVTADASLSRVDKGSAIDVKLLRPGDAMLLACDVPRADFRLRADVELKARRGVKRYSRPQPYVAGATAMMLCMVLFAITLGWFLSRDATVTPEITRSYFGILMFVLPPTISIGALYVTVFLSTPSSGAVSLFQTYEAIVARIPRPLGRSGDEG